MRFLSGLITSLLLTALLVTVLIASPNLAPNLGTPSGEVGVGQTGANGPATGGEEEAIEGPAIGRELGGTDATEPPDSISLETIWDGDGISFGFEAATYIVVQSEEEWLALWMRASVLNLAPPVVDFAIHMVLVAILGAVRTTGYSIQIQEVSAVEEGTYVAFVQVAIPGKACYTGPAIAYPVHMVSIARAEGSFQFTDESEIINCG